MTKQLGLRWTALAAPTLLSFASVSAAQEAAPAAPPGDAGSTATPAEEPAPVEPAASPTQDELTDLRRRIAELEGRVAEMESREPEPRAPVPAAPTASARDASDLEAAKANLSDRPSSIGARMTFREEHHAAPRPGNAPTDPKLQGFFPLGQTGVWLKLGGYAKLDVIVDSSATGTPNKFTTSAIYTTSDAGYDPEAHFAMHAKQSRLGFEARTPTKLGSLRVVYENDFFGDPTAPTMTYNLRHLYGQLANFTIGQTWTAYLDSDAIPDTLDFAGPGVLALRRVPQIRYTVPFAESAHLALAAEQPGSDLAGLPTDATAKSLAPDLTMALRVEDKELGHVHLGGVARVLAYDDDADETFAAFGWSANVSGALNVLGKDHVTLSATFGQGTGHYAQDLGAASAAVLMADGSLDALTTYGGFAGYRHLWVDGWTSQVTYGYLALEEHADLAASAYRETHYVQGNIVWSPADRLHVGLEYLYGHKSTQDGSAGDNHRGQLAVKHNLF